MATRVHVKTVVCPANTPQSAAVEQDCSFDAGIVEHIDIRISPGHAGLTGIALAVAHQPIIPYDAGSFIHGDAERIPLETDAYPQSGAWSAFVYNMDNRAHVWHISFHVRDLPRRVLPRETRRLSLVDIYGA